MSSSKGTPQAVHDSLHQDDESTQDLVIGLFFKHIYRFVL